MVFFHFKSFDPYKQMDYCNTFIFEIIRPEVSSMWDLYMDNVTYQDEIVMLGIYIIFIMEHNPNIE